MANHLHNTIGIYYIYIYTVVARQYLEYSVCMHTDMTVGVSMHYTWEFNTHLARTHPVVILSVNAGAEALTPTPVCNEYTLD